MAGVRLRTVRELMVHKAIAMTCRYAQLAPQHQLDAVSKLDGWGRESGNETDTKTDTSHSQESEGALVEHGQPLMQ